MPRCLRLYVCQIEQRHLMVLSCGAMPLVRNLAR